ncbi:MAG: hypothetical protein VXY07_05225 [Planctomycetota bacterium]|nr:hypothetical protein [Planctomycetota bacterium]
MNPDSESQNASEITPPEPEETSSGTGDDILEEGVEIVDVEIIDAEVVSEPLIWETPFTSSPFSTTREPSNHPGMGGNSPFAAEVTPEKPDALIPDRFTESYTARGAATAAVGLGILGLIASFFTGWGMVPCLLGVTMSFWGTTSSFRQRAVVGLALSLGAIVLCLFMSFVRPLSATRNPETHFSGLHTASSIWIRLPPRR